MRRELHRRARWTGRREARAATARDGDRNSPAFTFPVRRNIAAISKATLHVLDGFNPQMEA
ncbi:hypothetical protein BN2476_500111 [Paraburkholderia piptadeniae]|uniref:Uncharacterized protein n=1 Tax=Paraburkholderia piptadeniae TaxID=1701573 RepID=A0A1N7SFP6_9BURK|nr:hypothetical protein BN2476_500111 [Paraburkholderia piptadeniae]